MALKTFLQAKESVKLGIKILTPFILGVFLFLPLKTFAIVENFDNYQLNQNLIDVSPYWDLEGGVSPKILNDKYNSYPYSINTPENNSASIISKENTFFNNSTQGIARENFFVHKVYVVELRFDLRFNTGIRNCGITGTDDGYINIIYGNGTGNVSSYRWKPFDFDTWHLIQIEFEKKDDLKLYCKYKLDDEDWSDWYLGTYGITSPFVSYIWTEAANLNEAQLWIDDISNEPAYIPCPGYHPSISLEKPTICKYNQINLNAIEVKGRIDIPEDNPYTWDKLRFGFMNYDNNSYTQYFNTTTTPLTAGQGLAFDYTFEISTSTEGACPSPNYPPCILYFGMWAYGKDSEGNYYSEYYPYGCDTYVGDANEMVFIPPPEEEFPQYPELEDCSQYNVPDKWICEIKNSLKSIFLPSSQKIQELKTTIEQTKQKFPFNYITFFKDFYGDIKEGISATSTISFKILNQNGNVDLTFWEKTSNVGGIVQTFSHIVKNLATFIILLVFLMWLISFGRRIFK